MVAAIRPPCRVRTASPPGPVLTPAPSKLAPRAQDSGPVAAPIPSSQIGPERRGSRARKQRAAAPDSLARGFRLALGEGG